MASIKKDNPPSSLAPRIIRLNRQEEDLAARKINSKELFGDSQSLFIEHEGTTYCLRATKFGKLFIIVFACGLSGCSSPKRVRSGGNVGGGEISIGASTVINQKLMNEQNAVTPSEVYRNIPGVSR